MSIFTITGATGSVGKAIVKQLLHEGIVCAFSAQEKDTNGMQLKSTIGTQNKAVSTTKRWKVLTFSCI